MCLFIDFSGFYILFLHRRTRYTHQLHKTASCTSFKLQYEQPLGLRSLRDFIGIYQSLTLSPIANRSASTL